MLIDNIADRAAAYGIPGVVVDGNNVLAVYEATREAVERARGGGGPTLIECKTYRHKGHSRFDPAAYRPKDEVAEWLKRDPITLFENKLGEMGILSKEQIEKIRLETIAAVEEAVKLAMESLYPKPEEALEDVYAE
jgi:pyruvate dehydrogenase E1 component alpha subunit